MSTVTVVAKVIAKAGMAEELKIHLLKMLVPTRSENGCIDYRLHQDTENPAVFVFYENWETVSCLEHHMNSSHFKDYVAAAGPLVAEKTVYKMSEISPC